MHPLAVVARRQRLADVGGFFVLLLIKWGDVELVAEVVHAAVVLRAYAQYELVATGVATKRD